MTSRRDRTLVAVLVVTTLAILVRLVALGDRVAHWDEARVAYWILEYGATGVLFYQPVIHGPLLHLVNAPIVGALGATDFAIRLFPALVGGALPLSALLLRHRLRSEAVVALAILLAFNPVLLYYSRFMRNDILTAAFAFVAFALLVRAIDFRKARYLYAAAAVLALSFGAKENALAYLIVWAGAAVLLVDHRLFLARGLPEPWRARVMAAARKSSAWADVAIHGADDRSRKTAVVEGGRRLAERIRRPLAIGVGTVASFFVPFVYVYAPRGSLPSQSTYYRSCTDYGGYFDVSAAPTLGEALSNPLFLPRLVAFTVGSTAELYACQWISPRAEDPNPYVDYLIELAAITVETSTPLVALAIVGFLVFRYRGSRPDDLVAFSFYWGMASMIGYPYMTDIGGAAWLVVHIVLPLSIPAAVALGALFRWLGEGIETGDLVGAAATALVIVILLGSMFGTAYTTSIENTQSAENPLVQYAQPGSNDLKSTLSDVQQLSDGEGTDVLLYGEYLTNGGDSQELERRPVCSDWFNALPLPWYFEADGMAADCASDEDELDAALADDPPVVIVHEDDRVAVDARLEGYRAETHLLRSFDTPIVFYVDESRVN